jgi:antirestriction protein ArdC
LIRAIGADLRIGGDKAYYDVAGDFIRVPPPQAYFEPINRHRTVSHEHIHYAEVRIMPRRSAILMTGARSQRGISA